MSAPTNGASRLQIGIDIGGTFTDFVFVEQGGRVRLGKVRTDSKDPADGVIGGLDQLIGPVADDVDVERVIHGTTLATNAIIQRRGANVALVTTEGFRDVLQIGRERRYDVYDINFEPPAPLVTRRMVWEIAERTSAAGEVIEQPDPAAVEAVAQKLAAEGVEAVAICFVNSYVNPANERLVAEILLQELPEIAITTSASLVPEIREYQRTSSAVCNAYVQPAIEAYLDRVEQKVTTLAGAGRLYVMLSSGGITSPQAAARYPIRIVESGPAGGAIGAAYWGRAIDSNRVLSFDMGGTTAKACIIDDGECSRVNEFEVGRVRWDRPGSGLPILAPIIDMIEIGTGGGSIARVDDMGLVQVGPTSAGASPGPACYGSGGLEPTVTDADLVLGYIDPNYFLGGEMKLDVEAAERAIQERIASPLGLDLHEAAWGIHEIADEAMARAARLHSAAQGVDLSHYCMVAYGGAGPVHAYEVAQRLGISKLVVPPGAGVGSAFGLLIAPVSFQTARTYEVDLDEIDFERLNELLTDLEERALGMVRDEASADRAPVLSRDSAMRFKGQGYEFDVAVPAGRLDAEAIARLKESCRAAYRRLYGDALPAEGDAKIEALTWRVTATVSGAGAWEPPSDAWSSPSVGEARKGVRLAYSPPERTFVEHAVFDRGALTPGAQVPGPALIEERESTIVLGAGATAVIHPSGACQITINGGGGRDEPKWVHSA